MFSSVQQIYEAQSTNRGQVVTEAVATQLNTNALLLPSSFPISCGNMPTCVDCSKHRASFAFYSAIIQVSWNEAVSCLQISNPRDPSSHSTTWLPVNSRLPVPVRSWNVSVGRFIYADCASFRAYILLRHINLLRMNCVSILFDLWNKSKDGAVADEVLTTGLWNHSLLATGGYWDVELTLGFIRRRYGGFLLAQYNHCVRRDVTENAVDVQ